MSSAVTKLSCLMGGPAPAELRDNLVSLLALPPAVQQSFAEVLEPNLAAVIDDRVETRVKRYCRDHGIDPDALAPAIKACRFLFTSVVKAGIDREAFIRDVETLVAEPDRTPLLERVLPLFDEAYPKLMQAAALHSVAEHGKVVCGVRWRVETIQASDHGANLNVPVATITFQFREGPNAGQASYQFLPEQALELQRALANFIDPARASSG